MGKLHWEIVKNQTVFCSPVNTLWVETDVGGCQGPQLVPQTVQCRAGQSDGLFAGPVPTEACRISWDPRNHTHTHQVLLTAHFTDENTEVK